MVMIRNRKTVKGKLGNTRPKDTDFAGIARKQSKKKKTEQKNLKQRKYLWVDKSLKRNNRWVWARVRKVLECLML